MPSQLRAEFTQTRNQPLTVLLLETPPSRLGLELAVQQLNLTLNALDALDGILDEVDQTPLHRFGELDAANQLRELDPRPQSAPLVATVSPLVALEDGREFGFLFLALGPLRRDCIDLT